MPDVLMKCGHRANATIPAWVPTGDTTDRNTPEMEQGSLPCCAICAPRPEAYEIDENPPDLRNRKARCDCGKEVSSPFHLPFFEYRGPGSRFVRDLDPEGLSFDDYYCGHAGWD